jgi:Trk K+ transport system NAD-binding subunit
LAILIGFAVLGASHIEPPNLKPFAPLGLGPFLPAMALIYVSFVGFDLITVAAEEIIDPGRTIPRAILITLGIGIVIYVGVVGVMMGVVPYGELAQSDVPFILAIDRVFGAWGRWAGVIATIMASLSALSVTLGASARILYALGRDRHFPEIFARLHRRYRTPHVALLVCAIVTIAFASSGIVRLVASMSGFGYLMGQGIVNLAAIALRRRMPNLRRPFKVFLFPVVPVLGAIACWGFVPALEARSYLLGLLLTLVGSGLYLIRPANRAELRHVPAAVARLLLLIKAKGRKHMHVLIISGDKQGRNIADRLLARDEFRLMFRSAEHQVTFIEEDEALCRELEHRYNVPIYQGDGTKKELLEQVGLDNIDVAIAASKDDGRNVITALQARSLGIPRVIAIVQDPDYVPLLHENDVVAISAPWATAAMVENYLDRPGVADLFEIEGGAASLVSVIVPEQAQVAGKHIRDIDIPHACVVAAVIRDNQFVVPRGDTEIATGDHVVFVGPAPAIKKAQDLFRL